LGQRARVTQRTRATRMARVVAGKPVYSKEELKKIRDEIKEAMISAAQSTGAATYQVLYREWLRDLTEPKMDWREILQQQIMSTIKSDYTWMRPSAVNHGTHLLYYQDRTTIK
jgi:predicted metal-dependent peptidase